MPVQIVGGGRPAIPEGFRRRLHEQDRTLLVSWHEKRHRWLIEQCIGPHLPDGSGDHTHLCGRIYVYMVQDENRLYLPLGDHVLEELRRRDVSRLGYGPENADDFIRAMNQVDEANKAKIEADMADSVKHASRFNRRQLLQAVRLLQTHSLEVNQ
jgi:hypothetical protein